MDKQILQIESLEAQTLLGKLRTLSNDIKDVKQTLLNHTPQTEYITRKEVAKLFNVSLVTVSDWTKKGILTAYKIANRVYFKRNEIDNALTQTKKSK